MDTAERNLENRKFYIDKFYVPKLKEMGYEEADRRYTEHDHAVLTKNDVVDVVFDVVIDVEESDGFTFCYVHYFVNQADPDLPDSLIRHYHNRVETEEGTYWYRREFFRLIELEPEAIDNVVEEDTELIAPHLD